jgi:D-tyrosyl-tRNA(Tyr) deacylase
MRVVLQRVRCADVNSQGLVAGKIGPGWLILLGVSKSDHSGDVNYLVNKILNLRAFPDSEGKMNLSVMDIKGEFLVVSQFTLYGDCEKGRRPSFTRAAPAPDAQKLYLEFVDRLKSSGLTTQTGAFQQDMQVTLVNDGPVTFIIDSPMN